MKNLFLKKRTIFRAERDSFSFSDLMKKQGATFSLISLHAPQDLTIFNEKQKLGERAKSRLLYENVFVVVAMKGAFVAGFYWGARGQKKSVVWHDKFPLYENQGLAFNAYVFPEFRRMGVYRLLQYEVHRHLFGNGCQEVFTIVEESNIPSIRANTSFGLKIYAKNYLLKILGKNMISVIKGPEGVEIYYVATGSQSHNF